MRQGNVYVLMYTQGGYAEDYIATESNTVGRGYTQSTVNFAPIQNPYGMAVDASGNIFIASPGNNRLEKLAPGGAGDFGLVKCRQHKFAYLFDLHHGYRGHVRQSGSGDTWPKRTGFCQRGLRLMRHPGKRLCLLRWDCLLHRCGSQTPIRRDPLRRRDPPGLSGNPSRLPMSSAPERLRR